MQLIRKEGDCLISSVQINEEATAEARHDVFRR